MNEQRQRLALWIGALVLTLAAAIPKGHETPHGGASSVAFLREQGNIKVRIAGDVATPGVYTLPAGGTVNDLVRHAAPARTVTAGETGLSAVHLDDGALVTLRHGAPPHVGSLSARERLVLGVPLDPKRMTAADWEALPGIGPARAAGIAAYGGTRGGIRTLDDLSAIPGIGGQTITKLRPYFAADEK